jgi:hypothetical protein
VADLVRGHPLQAQPEVVEGSVRGRVGDVLGLEIPDHGDSSGVAPCAFSFAIDADLVR